MLERYNIPEMSAIWSEETKYRNWLKIEQIAMQVMYNHHIIDSVVEFPIKDSGLQEFIAACKERELSSQHDIVAFLSVLEDTLGDPGRFIHFGMTSSDVVDTGFALQATQAIDLVKSGLIDLCSEVLSLAKKHKYTIMIARTHGISAEPSTFGLILLNFYSELSRHVERLDISYNEISTGKLSGAIGTYSYLSPDIEAEVMKELGLTPEKISSQIVNRDRYACVMNELALLASSIERLALEIRLLARSDTGEVEETHSREYAGSSAMPQKSNPIGSENLCGMARIIRGYTIPILENISLHHERDLSSSCVERMVFPDAFGLVLYMVKRMTKIMTNLQVNTEKMLEKVERTSHQWLSQAIMLHLIKKGMLRQNAHTLVKDNILIAMKQAGWDESRHPGVHIKEHLKYVDDIFKRFGE